MYKHQVKTLVPNSKSQIKRLVVQQGTPGEEEAYLHFILNGFKEVVEKYGVSEVLKQLDDKVVYDVWNEIRITYKFG